jgi:hypothetical protein
VKPLAFVSTVVPATFAVFRPDAAAAAEVDAEGVLEPEELAEVPDEPHAARTARPAAPAGSASNVHRRRWRIFRSCEVVMYFSFARWPWP